jgi:hypothetical protein
MARRVTRTNFDPAKLVLFAALGVAGMLLARRYGAVTALKAVNQGLRVARIVRSARSGATTARKRPARRVRPEVLGFSGPD